MPSVDGQVAAWLKSPALFTGASPGGIAWDATQGVDAEFMSPIDLRADAFAEAGRHAAFLQGPNVKDRILVKGARRDLLFKCVTVKEVRGRLGYGGAGKNVFVVGVQENENGTTSLTVIRKL